MSRFSIILTALLASNVAAHGYLNTFTLDDVKHEGFSRWNPSPDPKAIGWSFTTEDEGPEMDISSPDFVCRRSSKPSKNYAKVAAGGTASFFWTSDDKVINPNGWAESHRGPVITYIAPCNGDCASVDKTKLKWTKIAEEGLISGPANTQGVWATDKLRQNGGVNKATIPKSIAPGKYVIRNELIALHRAHLSEPEFYMQCGNIEVTGKGADNLSGSGVVASKLYSTSDKQMFGFSVYDNRGDSWKIPGPALYKGGKVRSAKFGAKYHS
ncbi:Polysaccharide monooxygenase Cel61a [Fusarium austroafricanum]|uniref:lytic cellulose monooxygenase (C4-dehydrogenating) n=1 Tax=Fusarium austroafricanum TaxID=2364996 RepID=A0A8H4K1M1_9HYPO|nr:Polysaccharide monooxygenase Cel61a [Fusarium austroafricanum]